MIGCFFCSHRVRLKGVFYFLFYGGGGKKRINYEHTRKHAPTSMHAPTSTHARARNTHTHTHTLSESK